MNPKVSNKSENDGILNFTLSQTNVSIANAIRRVIFLIFQLLYSEHFHTMIIVLILLKIQHDLQMK